MKRYADIGVDVHITEIDVKCPWDYKTRKCAISEWDDEALTK